MRVPVDYMPGKGAGGARGFGGHRWVGGSPAGAGERPRRGLGARAAGPLAGGGGRRRQPERPWGQGRRPGRRTHRSRDLSNAPAPIPELALPPSQVEELMTLLSKGMRATQLYLPNNPVYQRAVENIRGAFRHIWQATDDLHFDVGETDLRWEGAVVYHQEQKNESIAWTLYKDGVRSLLFKPGVEDQEIVGFLRVLHLAKTLQADAADDLLTLLWQEDFQFIAYTFRELATENAVPIEAGETIPSSSPSDVRRVVVEEAPPPREGLVSIDDFDTTLYFLDDTEIDFLHKSVEPEYAQDLPGNVLAMLFDLLELQTYRTVRADLISIVENFIPYLLGAGDFRSVASILRESRTSLH